MSKTIGAFDLDDYRALVRMSESDLPFAATIARATLAIVEARRDAEVRAASAEASLDSEYARIGAIRDVLQATVDGSLDRDEALDRIARLAGVPRPAASR